MRRLSPLSRAPGLVEAGRTHRASPYGSPRLYDILNTPGTAAEVDVLQRIQRRFGPGASKRSNRKSDQQHWLEPACGTGRYLRVLAGRGRRVTGFDRDRAMVDYARDSLAGRGLCLRSRVFQADLTDFASALAPESVDFALIPVNSIRHLLSDRTMLQHLAQMARVLCPGGLYAVGITLADYVRDVPEEDIWRGTRGRCRITQVVNFLPPGSAGDSGSAAAGRREMVLSHLMVVRPRGTEHYDSSYALRTYNRRQWTALIGRSALEPVVSLDARGRPLQDKILPYQFELLRRPA